MLTLRIVLLPSRASGKLLISEITISVSVIVNTIDFYSVHKSEQLINRPIARTKSIDRWPRSMQRVRQGL